MRTTLLAVALCLAIPVAAGRVHATSADQDEMMKLIVMVSGTHLEGKDRVGAGIIFGADKDHLYIATANHVVAPRGEVHDVRVTFKFHPGEVPAKVLDTFSPSSGESGGLDLAVLSVEGIKGLGVDVGKLPFDRLSDPTVLKSGDHVHVIGNPDGKAWHLNPTPDQFSATSGGLLRFKSNFIAQGASGGALLDEHYQLLGMVIRDEPTNSVAVSMAEVLKTVSGWGYPVALRNRFVSAEVVRLSAGSSHNCYVTTSGAAYCWGYNEYGQLGNGSFTNATAPVLVDGPLPFVSVSAGRWFTCGVVTSGVAYCWGNDGGEPVGARPKVFSPRPAAVSTDVKFRSISAGHDHTCGVAASGAAYCWGNGEDGELGNGARQPDGEAGVLGNAALHPGAGPVPVSGNLRFSSVSAGFNHNCGVTTDRTAYCWGDNGGGQLGDGSTTSRTTPVAVKGGLQFTSVSAGAGFTCGIATGGAAYCWGANGLGRLGSGKGGDSTIPLRVAGSRVFKMLDAGYSHTCGVAENGAAYCWGDEEGGASGALGNDYEHTNEPELVQGTLTFESVSTGHFHTCGVTPERAVYCWGSNKYGQLGHAADTWVNNQPSRVSIQP